MTHPGLDVTRGGTLMRKAMVLILVLCAVAPVFAYMKDGSELVQDWRSVLRVEENTADITDHQKAMYFMGYVTAIFDVLDGNPVFVWGRVSVRQLTTVVGRWLEAHPERWHEPAPDLVYAAFFDAFGA